MTDKPEHPVTTPKRPGPWVHHRWRQTLNEPFTGYGLTEATRAMLAEREKKKEVSNARAE